MIYLGAMIVFLCWIISVLSPVYMQQVAMCHMSEVADHYFKDIDKHYKVGDRVRARVLKVRTEVWHERNSGQISIFAFDN